jgi:hypothetical protein
VVVFGGLGVAIAAQKMYQISLITIRHNHFSHKIKPHLQVGFCLYKGIPKINVAVEA